MARWDGHTEQQKLEAIARKRANEREKRRANPTLRSKPVTRVLVLPYKPTPEERRQRIIEKMVAALPVELITGSRLYLLENPQTVTDKAPEQTALVVSSALVPSSLPESLKQFQADCREILAKYKDSGDIDASSGLKLDKEMNDYLGNFYWYTLHHVQPPANPSSDAIFWGTGISPAQPATDITKEIQLFLEWKEVIARSEAEYREILATQWHLTWSGLLAEAREQLEKEIVREEGLQKYFAV